MKAAPRLFPPHNRHELNAKEHQAFVALWQHGATLDEIRSVLGKLQESSAHAIRIIAVMSGLAYFRPVETRTANGVIDDKLLKQILKRPKVL